MRPLLEPTANAPSTWWARRWARVLGTLVTIGYPERTLGTEAVIRTGDGLDDLIEPPPPGSAAAERPGRPGRTFNAMITVGPHTPTVAHARKHHLYFTDAPWAQPGAGFTTVDLPLAATLPASDAPGLSAADAARLGAPAASAAPMTPTTTRTAFGICMDLNPRFFRAAWDAHELAAHALATDARLLLVSTAWMQADAAPGAEPPARLEAAAGNDEPDVKTIVYWISRLAPLVAAPHRTLVVIANRTGVEPGAVRACDLRRERDTRRALDWAYRESPGAAGGNDGAAREEGNLVASEARYVGSSCVLLLGGGRAVCLGAMGRAEEGVAVVDVAKGAAEGVKMQGVTWVVRDPGERM